VSSDDADIDALMGSVLGHDGTPAEFPKAPARPVAQPRVRVTASTSALVTAERQGIAGLSGELAAILAKNSAPKIIDPRDVPVRFSSLKHISRSPLHYYDAVQLDREDTMAMRLGRGAHAMVLGMPVVLYPGKTRQGKNWARFKADQDPAAEILIRSEWTKAEGIARAIQRHPDASQLLYDGTVLEQIIEWEFLGRKCTSRPDSRCARGRVITDLKTTQCAEPEKFKRDAMYRGYNAQLAFYDQAVEYLTGRQADELYVAAVESKRPYAVTILRLTDEARTEGRKLCRIWFEQVLLYEASNHYPAYVDHVVDLDVPDGSGELTLTIDGEEYDFDEDAA
jgi:hypothetical protein